ncbi:DUF3817 domain-containing protein [Bacillaceae bacterium SIJ1]|uniref:DUF3817 domain-containing protein n=1 Tax=Litoribacterium kuwaitense TaxID=1398745 RepID=UPI0013EDE131|nr:DUF3817 domain-containing protein [Litoribacterium kuwaitense]NGP46600.1 DUF3817 domain-containing protein [Litoribacterium kuwaitense]
MLSTALGRFRFIGILEGISFILLLAVAMPLKYGAGMDMAVSIAGMAHGVLFILYIMAIAHVTMTDSWKAPRITGAVLAAFIPFGPFYLDARLKKEAI